MKIVNLDLSFQNLYTFDFSRYTELKSLDLSNNNFENLDLSDNLKLIYLELFGNSELLFEEINFGESKKSLEEIGFIKAFEGQTINLTGFQKIKKISYD